jgi:hypothetical protein
MKRFWTDRIAIGTALVGIGLMVLTIFWRINPAEGSVVPKFLTSRPVGVGVMWVLLITCMPAWFAAVSLSTLMPLSDHVQYGVACGLMIILQCIVYFLLGKLISLSGRKLLRRKESSNQGA